jgi:hypothetical protein
MTDRWGRIALWYALLSVGWVVASGGCSDDGLLGLGRVCETPGDCQSDRCEEGVCKAADPKGPGEACGHPLQCRSENCRESVCAVGMRAPGVSCRDDLQCASGSCSGGVCGGPVVDGAIPDRGGPDGGPPLDAAADLPVIDAAVVDGPVSDGPPADLPVIDAAPADQGAFDGGVAPPHVWSHRFGGSGDDEGRGVAALSSGEIWLGAAFASTSIDFGGNAIANTGGWEIAAAQLRINGNHRRSLGVEGTANDEQVWGIAIDASDRVYLVGSQAGDVLVVRIAANGRVDWSATFGGAAEDLARDIAIDANGNLYLTGSFASSAIDFGGGSLSRSGSSGSDIFLVSLDTDGNHRWSVRFGNSGDDAGRAIALDGSGNLYLTGEIGSALDFGGGAVSAPGGSDIFVASFTGASGTHRWSSGHGGSGDDTGQSIAADYGGNVFVVGGFRSTSINLGGGNLTNASGAGTADLCLASLVGSSGAHRWSQSFGGALDEVVTTAGGLVVAPGGDLYLTGRFDSTQINLGGGWLTNASAGDGDIFVAGFSAAGVHRWSRRFGGTANDWGAAVVVDGSGRLSLLGGAESSALSLGGGALVGLGGSDLFVARFGP